MAASKVLVWEDPGRIDKVGHLIFPDGQNRGRGSGAPDRGQYDREEEVLWPDGCAAMYRKEMLERIGGFDEDFFAYGDDAELGLRARIAGWKCIYTPEAVVRHHRGSTLGKDSARRLELIERNRLLLAIKLFPWSLLWLNPIYFAARVAAGLAAARRGEGDTAHFPGVRRQVGDGARAGSRRSGGAAPGAAHAAQARGNPAHPPAHAGRSAAADSGASPEPEGSGMSACLVCGSRALGAAVPRRPDRLYRTTAKEFAVVRCRECGLARLDPQPAAEELRRYYPENYWFAPDESAASRLEEAYRRLVLRDHVRFVTQALAAAARAGRCSTWGAAADFFWG